jgi:hypothetical protein
VSLDQTNYGHTVHCQGSVNAWPGAASRGNDAYSHSIANQKDDVSWRVGCIAGERQECEDDCKKQSAAQYGFGAVHYYLQSLYNNLR